ncbi:MAG: glycosyltransferase family 4 protein [Sphingomonadaceae bacterium]|nr:glycosyltransferase family 4 protein [Sphingomonadaceae bacterium]
MEAAQNILLCCEQYPPSIGGVQEVMRQIAERLAKMGHVITVATSRHPNRPRDAVVNGVRVVSFDVSGNAVKGLAGDIKPYQDFLRVSDFDIILIKAAQQWTFDGCVDILDELRARKTFIPCGFSALHHPDYASYYTAMPDWLRKFDALIFYSDTYQDIEFARRHGLKNLHVIPNGVDEREFFAEDASNEGDRLGVSGDSLLLLSVGTLIVAKGHWEVVKAYRRASIERSSELIINGNRPKVPVSRIILRSIRDAAKGYWPLSLTIQIANAIFSLTGEQKRIRLVDLPRHELVSLYKGADLFLFASHLEYSPLVLFEAAAAGVPFISTDVGNAREIAGWTDGGIVITQQTDVSATGTTLAYAFVAAIERRCNELCGVRRSLSETQLRYTNAGLTWHHLAKRYWRVINGESLV